MEDNIIWPNVVADGPVAAVNQSVGAEDVPKLFQSRTIVVSIRLQAAVHSAQNI